MDAARRAAEELARWCAEPGDDPTLPVEELEEVAAILRKHFPAPSGDDKERAREVLQNLMHREFDDENAVLIASALAATRRARDEEIRQVLMRVWSFDERQQHRHSWHDREDFNEWLLGKDTDGAGRIRALQRPEQEEGEQRQDGQV